MMGRRKFGLGVMGLFAGAAMLSGCSSSASFRYRMTVEGTNGGTAVYELLAEKVNGPRLAEEKPGGSIIKGEALVIETPSGPVFVLLTSGSADDNPKSGILSALAPDVSRNEEPYSYAVATKLSGSFSRDAKGELSRNNWPMMVRFRDINDPKSVEKVDPASIGVTRILLETTSDAVTTGIEGRLVWLDALESSLTNSIVQTSASSLVDQLRKK